MTTVKDFLKEPTGIQYVPLHPQMHEDLLECDKVDLDNLLMLKMMLKPTPHLEYKNNILHVDGESLHERALKLRRRHEVI